jgi:hypothetical protein
MEEKIDIPHPEYDGLFYFVPKIFEYCNKKPDGIHPDVVIMDRLSDGKTSHTRAVAKNFIRKGTLLCVSDPISTVSEFNECNLEGMYLSWTRSILENEMDLAPFFGLLYPRVDQLDDIDKIRLSNLVSFDMEWDKDIPIYLNMLPVKIKCNMFNIPSEDKGIKRFGIYFCMSFFDHSCVPNAVNMAENGAKTTRRILKSTRDILKGEDITCQYDIALPDDTKLRKKKLFDQFGFECGCKCCSIIGHPPPSSTSVYNYCICRGCGKMQINNMMRCTNCKHIYYCSKECQKIGWKFHKKDCKRISNDVEVIVRESQMTLKSLKM